MVKGPTRPTRSGGQTFAAGPKPGQVARRSPGAQVFVAPDISLRKRAGFIGPCQPSAPSGPGSDRHWRRTRRPFQGPRPAASERGPGAAATFFCKQIVEDWAREAPYQALSPTGTRRCWQGPARGKDARPANVAVSGRWHEGRAVWWTSGSLTDRPRRPRAVGWEAWDGPTALSLWDGTAVPGSGPGGRP